MSLINSFYIQRSTRKRCEICSKLKRKSLERRQWCSSGVFINLEFISHLLLMSLLLTLILHSLPRVEFLHVKYEEDCVVCLSFHSKDKDVQCLHHQQQLVLCSTVFKLKNLHHFLPKFFAQFMLFLKAI